MLSDLLDTIDDDALELIIKVAPFAEIEYHGYQMFEWLEKMSESYPKQSCTIWQSMIQDSSPAHLADSSQILLKNIVRAGFRDEAEEIVETYLSRGSLTLHNWMKENRRRSSPEIDTYVHQWR